MRPTRRGFINVGAERKLPMPYGFAAMSPPYLRGLLNRLEDERPIREVTVYKGTSVGPTTGILGNALGYAIEELRREHPADGHAFAGMNYEGDTQWSARPSSPIDDLNALANWLRSPGYQAALEAERRAYSAEMKRRASHLAALAALVRKPGLRPDIVVIDGIGYGKDDPLPPPFGGGA